MRTFFFKARAPSAARRALGLYLASPARCTSHFVVVYAVLFFRPRLLGTERGFKRGFGPSMGGLRSAASFGDGDKQAAPLPPPAPSLTLTYQHQRPHWTPPTPHPLPARHRVSCVSEKSPPRGLAPVATQQGCVSADFLVPVPDDTSISCTTEHT
jgi:hypothetical protein